MNKLKTILLSVALLVSASFTTQAQSANRLYSASNIAATNVQAVATAGVLNYVYFSTTNAAGAIVRLYDGPISNITGALTNVVRYPTNEVTTYVTTTGITNTFTNTVMYIGRVAQGALTNDTPPLYIIAVPPPPQSIGISIESPFTRSLYLSNSAAGLTANIFYRLP